MLHPLEFQKQIKSLIILHVIEELEHQEQLL